MARDSGYPRTHFAAGPRNPASPSAAMRSKWLKSDPTVDVCLEVYPAPEIRLKKIEMIFNLFQFKKKISVGGMLLIQHACGNLMGAKKKIKITSCPMDDTTWMPWNHVLASLQVFFLIIIVEVPFALFAGFFLNFQFIGANLEPHN